jgi:hypothetical protein
MTKKLELTGQTFGKWLVLREGNTYISPRGYKKATWVCECTCILANGKKCGVVKTLVATKLKSGRTSKCKSCSIRIDNIKHNNCIKKRTKEYSAWSSLKSRCINPNHRQYKDYGGRGITICDDWLTFNGFFADMGLAPSKSHSIDRINNDLGYCKSNCRWSTKTQQVINRRVPSKNTSGYRGVRWCKRDKLWVATIGINGKTKSLGSFKDINEAIAARLAAEEIYYKPLLSQNN